MRIVVDTNVLASAVIFGGKPAELMHLVQMQFISAVATEEILVEYRETIDYLLKKYASRKVSRPIDPFLSVIEIIPSRSHVNVCRDPDDDKFISCAIDGQCYYIVSGDKDLLTLKEHQQIKIVTVSEFLEILRNQRMS